MAVAAARDILSEIIGDLLGWVITLAVLAVPVLVIYFALKRLGYEQIPLIKAGKAKQFGFRVELGDGRLGVEPVEPVAPAEGPPEAERSGIEAPQWQKEMMGTWEKESQVQGRAVATTLRERKRHALRFYRWLVYGMVGALVAGAGFFWLQAMRGQAVMWVAGLLSAGGAAVVYAWLNPAQFD